jgi:hypothetical protein
VWTEIRDQKTLVGVRGIHISKARCGPAADLPTRPSSFINNLLTMITKVDNIQADISYHLSFSRIRWYSASMQKRLSIGNLSVLSQIPNKPGVE